MSYPLSKKINELLPLVADKHGVEIEIKNRFNWYERRQPKYSPLILESEKYVILEQDSPNAQRTDLGVMERRCPAIQADQIKQILIALKDILGEVFTFEPTNTNEKILSDSFTVVEQGTIKHLPTNFSSDTYQIIKIQHKDFGGNFIARKLYYIKVAGIEIGSRVKDISKLKKNFARNYGGYFRLPYLKSDFLCQKWLDGLNPLIDTATDQVLSELVEMLENLLK